MKSQLIPFQNIYEKFEQLEFLNGLTRRMCDWLWKFLEPAEENIYCAAQDPDDADGLLFVPDMEESCCCH